MKSKNRFLVSSLLVLLCVGGLVSACGTSHNANSVSSIQSTQTSDASPPVQNSKPEIKFISSIKQLGNDTFDPAATCSGGTDFQVVETGPYVNVYWSNYMSVEKDGKWIFRDKTLNIPKDFERVGNYLYNTDDKYKFIQIATINEDGTITTPKSYPFPQVEENPSPFAIPSTNGDVLDIPRNSFGAKAAIIKLDDPNHPIIYTGNTPDWEPEYKLFFDSKKNILYHNNAKREMPLTAINLNKDQPVYGTDGQKITADVPKNEQVIATDDKYVYSMNHPNNQSLSLTMLNNNLQVVNQVQMDTLPTPDRWAIDDDLNPIPSSPPVYYYPMFGYIDNNEIHVYHGILFNGKPSIEYFNFSKPNS